MHMKFTDNNRQTYGLNRQRLVNICLLFFSLLSISSHKRYSAQYTRPAQDSTKWNSYTVWASISVWK